MLRTASDLAARGGSSNRSSVYEEITNQIVAAIEAGADEWRMPWHHDGTSIARPRNAASDRAYRGINILALWVAARHAGYGSGVWGTYRQWAQCGCQVRKGEKATIVVFWKEVGKGSDDTTTGDADQADADQRNPRPRFFARGYCVFNEAQVDGGLPHPGPHLDQSERITRADAFFSALGIPIVSGGNEACYRPDTDTMLMPPFKSFVDAASYYSCLAHEACHAVGAKHRLDRDLTGRFGSAKYAMDEIVCELASSFIMADLGIAHRPRAEHAAYVASWLEVLKGDPRAIFTAAGKAQQAADWMHAQQPEAPIPMP